jgi:hypothetical protein
MMGSVEQMMTKTPRAAFDGITLRSKGSVDLKSNRRYLLTIQREDSTEETGKMLYVSMGIQTVTCLSLLR